MLAFILYRTTADVKHTGKLEFITYASIINNRWHCTWEWEPSNIKVFYDPSSYTQISEMYKTIGIEVYRTILS